MIVWRKNVQKDILDRVNGFMESQDVEEKITAISLMMFFINLVKWRKSILL